MDAVHRARSGELLYKLYRALTYGASPLVHLYLRWRKLHGLEHALLWSQRLGRTCSVRPSGHLLWFHAVSLGEGMAAIPIIKQCAQLRPEVNILMTTTTLSALYGRKMELFDIFLEVLRQQLPNNVIYQFAPVDTPAAIEAFLGHWKPDAAVILENELWPNLIMNVSKYNIKLALLNARMSARSFRKWSTPMLQPLVSLLLSKFSLIVPLSTLQAVQFQLLQASPFIVHFCGDLKYAVNEYDNSSEYPDCIRELKSQFFFKQIWMAASIHKGEEQIILDVHDALIPKYPDMVTVIVPRDPAYGMEIVQELCKRGKHVAWRSLHKKLNPGINIYVVDTLGELRHFYKMTPIAVIGGSFLSGFTGHNLSEAASAGCAVLTGYHVGHFSHMVQEMQQLNSLAVLQVTGAMELEKAVTELFGDAKLLESRQIAAKEAYSALSNGVAIRAWNLLSSHCLLFFDTKDRGLGIPEA